MNPFRIITVLSSKEIKPVQLITPYANVRVFAANNILTRFKSNMENANVGMGVMEKCEKTH